MRKTLTSLKGWVGIATVVGVLAALVFGVLEYRKDDSIEGHVSDCREAHDAPTEPRDTVFSQGRWADCAWPPPRGGGSDGYGVIELARVDNGSIGNAGYEGADIFDTACDRVTIQYRHDQGGVVAISRQQRVDVGQVLRLGRKSDVELHLEPGTLPAWVSLDIDQIADGKLVVLVPIAVQVTRLACA